MSLDRNTIWAETQEEIRLEKKAKECEDCEGTGEVVIPASNENGEIRDEETQSCHCQK